MLFVDIGWLHTSQPFYRRQAAQPRNKTMATTAIIDWLAANHWISESSHHGSVNCFIGPSGGYLILDDGDDVEPPFWRYYAPGNEDGEQADQSGEWSDTPK